MKMYVLKAQILSKLKIYWLMYLGYKWPQGVLVTLKLPQICFFLYSFYVHHPIFFGLFFLQHKEVFNSVGGVEAANSIHLLVPW